MNIDLYSICCTSNTGIIGIVWYLAVLSIRREPADAFRPKSIVGAVPEEFGESWFGCGG